ncbi:hypothetical protein [Elizabethkingia anophelis]|jgi:hypothetical protein|uniref:hypothetical protein n=1 Tax=Elizabethkingia anophelis TaxID=1117645 RepID=UPI0021A54C85|nr:hypothetical protein [Elizabethkingia anophelis]MDV4070032.1 hypothetical protein [Elizabethkingia anophelis]
MKALEEMNNVEKGYILAKLFSKNLKEISLFIQQETERFRTHEEYMRSIWADKTLITANFWFGLVENTERILKQYNVMLQRNPRVFSDQLFDGYNAIFVSNSLIEYAEKPECNHKLKQAIHLLFGEQKMIEVPLNDNNNGELVQ